MRLISINSEMVNSVKVLLIISIFSLGSSAYAQDKYLTRNGEISFYSKAPVEDIESHTNKVLSIIDIKTGEVAVSMLMKSFEFEKKLMQEHFNENYIESHKFPKATFKGIYEVNENISAMKDGEYSVNAKGELLIHGVTHDIEIPVVLTILDSKLSANFVFTIKVKDYGIKIPKVVVKNIAEEVKVTAHFDYEPYN